MFTQRHYPTSLAPAELDRYLARGWFRMGQVIFTTRFIFFDARLYTCIWLRLPLADYQPAKRLRKLVRRNEARFRVEYGPLDINAEKEKLYLRYTIDRDRFGADNLRLSLLGYDDQNIYNTWESRVYDGERLIAFSFFDLGKTSMESISGVYDPDYARHSLGMYTMLLEIDFARRRGMTHYYPGYIVPGYPPFDYKTRIGPDQLEYYRPDADDWRPFPEFDPEVVPSRRMIERLNELLLALQAAEIPALRRIYPPHDIHMHTAEEESVAAMAFPIFVQVYPTSLALSQAYCIHFDFRDEAFVLAQYIVYSDIARNYNIQRKNPKDYRAICTNILIEDRPLLRTPSVEYMVEHLYTTITQV